MAQEPVLEENTEQVIDVQEVLLDNKDFLRDVLQKSLQDLFYKEFEEFMGVSSYERSEKGKDYRNGTRPGS